MVNGAVAEHNTYRNTRRRRRPDSFFRKTFRRPRILIMNNTDMFGEKEKI